MRSKHVQEAKEYLRKNAMKSSSDYWRYVEELRSAVNPDCAECPAVGRVVSKFALEVVEETTVFNRRHTRVKFVDTDKAERLLTGRAMDLIENFFACKGPKIVEPETVDPELVIQDHAFLFPPETPLPATEACGLFIAE